MTVFVLPSYTTAAYPARIGYVNLMEQGTVVASSENSSYPVANCFDWLTCDFFRPAAGGTVNIDLTLTAGAAADYFAFYNQDLWSLGGTIKLQYWNGSTYVDATPAITPADNAPRMVFFDSISSSKWRVVVTCSSVFNIGVISFGPQLALPFGMYLNWTRPLLGRSTQLLNSVSDSGSFLGRSIIAKGIKTTLELQYASDAWVTANWLPFIKSAELKPFFFAPNVTDYPTEAAFCWAENELTAPTNTHYGYLGTSIAIRGLVE